MLGRPAAELLDRESERDELERLLADARMGRSGVLLLRGEPGIGKTELLRFAAREAAGFRVAAIAGLHQLLAPLIGESDALPEPQQVALAAALGIGLASTTTPDRFLVSLATLGLLSSVASERPLLCLIDDAQWLDRSTAQVLAFVARRLQADPVALVLAARPSTNTDAFKGLPELIVPGLPEQDARILLELALPGRLDARITDRILAETAGNPLALIEVPRGMTAAEFAGGFEIPRTADVYGRLEESYRRRIATLPEATQLVLLLAAAEPTGDAALVTRARRALALSAEAVLPAAEADLLEIGAEVRFRHPLVRSTVYHAASAADRRRVHQALADATDAEVDPDRRAWHRAGAAPGPDEDIAMELERSADRALARGGLAAAAAFLQRAVALTPDRQRRAERALAAAEASIGAGALEAARAALSMAESSPCDELQRGRLAFLRGRIVFAEGRASDAPPLLLAAGRQLAAFDLDLARAAYLTAWGAAAYGGAESVEDLVATGRAIRALPSPPDPPRAVDLLLDGLALLVTEGRSAAAPHLLRATSAFSSDDLSVQDGLRWGAFATAASNALWDDDGLRAVCTRQIEIVRGAGALGSAQSHLFALGNAAARSGDFRACASLSAQANAIAEATGTSLVPHNQLVALALQGRETEATALIEATLEHAAHRGQGEFAIVARYAAALLYNGLGRYDEARRAAEAASTSAASLFSSMWSLPEWVEAAARSGAGDVARAAAERLTETTRPASTDYGLGIEARSWALVTDGPEAEALHREAIERLKRTRMRADLARAHLLYGEWLHGEGRDRDAARSLDTAHEMFREMQMQSFAERARRHLAATGASGRQAAMQRDVLTNQERQIAQLAAEGLSNQEVSERMVLSPRTVEWHLHKVFAKLGIRSRRQLGAALQRVDDV